MIFKRGEIWTANLDPKQGKEVGKLLPVVIVQTDLLNQVNHPTVLIMPISSRYQKENILRLAIQSSGLKKDSFVLIDQIRAIDTDARLHKKIGDLPTEFMTIINQRIKAIFQLL